jgi:PXPV repeat (3 copies)
MRKAIASLLIGAGLVALSGTAAARTNIDVGFSFGVPAPVYYPQRPPVAYYPPAPYVAPAPVYVAPAPVYVAPAPVYYGPPRYYYRHHAYHGHRRW